METSHILFESMLANFKVQNEIHSAFTLKLDYNTMSVCRSCF